MPTRRTRLCVGLVSLAAIALELALMRTMSLRFWHHFAHMVISVALLGFGAAGTVLTLLRRKVLARRRAWMLGFSAAFAVSIPLSLLAAEAVPLNVLYLAWDTSQLSLVVLVELAMFVPFFLAAGLIGVALMDRPRRLSGHYAANLVGSGVGALAAVAAMHVLTTGQLLTACSVTALLAAAVIAPWRRIAAVVAVALAVGLTALAAVARYEPRLSPDKTLAVWQEMLGTQIIHRDEGPLGRLDVVANPDLHYAPWLSLGYVEAEPPHLFQVFDGDAVSPVYDCRSPEDWGFMDYTTAAAAYHVTDSPGRVLVIGAGGGADIGLAVHHRAGSIVALEMNGHVIDAMMGVLRHRGGSIYTAPGVTVVNREARGYLASADDRFDVIQLPPVDSFGALGAGLHAARESYLYTVESFESMLRHLGPTGVLCVTRRAWAPPRDGLRVFDTAAAALERTGRRARRHLAMIRSWATVTVLVFAAPITERDEQRVHRFSRARGFDVCYLPGQDNPPAEPFHLLDRAYFFEGTRALLGPDRQSYLADYVYDVAAATDDKPYFHHFVRWRTLSTIGGQQGVSKENFLELGYVMLIAALIQACVLAAAMILLPLCPRLGALRAVAGRGATFAYFLLLGAGFMLLEMSFLQKLILYLAHPIYSAAVVIASFLVFAGAGSALSRRWAARPARVITTAGLSVAGIAMLCVFMLDEWLAASQGQGLAIRIIVAAVTIAPPAVAMGHMFPTALRGVSSSRPSLVPWAWAVNGFASVAAVCAAPVLAMSVGFSGLILAGAGCYAAAAVIGRKHPLAPRDGRW